MATFCSKNTVSNLASTFEPAPSNKSIIDYCDVVRKVFVGPDMNVIKLLVDESKARDLVVPTYDKNLCYSEKVQAMESVISKNLLLLKKHCFEVNWLDDYTELSANDEDISTYGMLSQKKRSRVRRSPTDMEKSNVCPYMNCDKSYTSKTS